MKIIKIGSYVFIGLLLLLTLIVVGFIQFSPQMGGRATEAQKAEYEKTGHYKEGKFLNLEPFELKFDCHSIKAMFEKWRNPPPNKLPKSDIIVDTVDFQNLLRSGDSVTWLGHSSFLIRIDNKTILLDPVFGQYASPIPIPGQERYSSKMPIEREDIPFVDALLISHDHYDHLEYKTISLMADKTDKFYVALGVGNHLRRWKVPEEKIVELDWWDQKQAQSLTFVLAPSQHMSGRGLSDQSATLWGSWIIKGENKKLYFSGDSGYGNHFKDIGKKHGPFDLALMECGQYDDLWPDVHMTPEQSVQATLEVKAKLMVPIHWGAFTLSNHVWSEPAVRATAEAKRKNVNVATPRIGETILLTNVDYPTSRWWEKY